MLQCPTQVAESITINSEKFQRLREDAAMLDCTIVYGQKERQLNKFFTSLRSGYFYSSFHTFKTNEINLTECPFDELIIEATLDFIYFDFKQNDIIQWILEGKPVDDLYESSQYFQIDDLELTIKNALTFIKGQHSSRITDTNIFINYFKSLDKLFKLNELKDLTCWIFESVQIQYFDYLRNTLSDFPMNSFKTIIAQEFSLLNEEERFSMVLSAYQDRTEQDQLILKPIILNHFDFSQISPAIALGIASSLDEAKHIYHIQSNARFRRSAQPLIFQNNFIYNSTVDICSTIAFTYKEQEYEAQIEDSVDQPEYFKGAYMSFDFEQMMNDKKLPEFQLTLLETSTFRVLTKFCGFQSKSYSDYLKEYNDRDWYGESQFINKADLIHGSEYTFIVKFYGYTAWNCD
ncbi:hypothetical protein BC833DRAFT_575995 [Globomyces pollinis-pini]|nr:hypothetical protein BC833DRAFT_575995 [Globomyces pollinis-pini]